MFVVPSFSRNAALLDCTALLAVRVDLNNFTIASTLQVKVSAIRREPENRNAQMYLPWRGFVLFDFPKDQHGLRLPLQGVWFGWDVFLSAPALS